MGLGRGRASPCAGRPESRFARRWEARRGGWWFGRCGMRRSRSGSRGVVGGREVGALGGSLWGWYPGVGKMFRNRRRGGPSVRPLRGGGGIDYGGGFESSGGQGIDWHLHRRSPLAVGPFVARDQGLFERFAIPGSDCDRDKVFAQRNPVIRIGLPAASGAGGGAGLD